MNPIGGYFSLELPLNEEYHKDAIKLNTGRNCIEYILRARKYIKVYIPYYTCDVTLEPICKLHIIYEFYHINNDFELIDDIKLKQGEALIYVNYFGLKQQYIKSLAKKYGNQLIVDNTQAFYADHINGIDTFYTCRKYFGVPDGAYLYTDSFLNEKFEQDKSYERISFLTKRIDISPEAGYIDFREQSRNLIGQPIKMMSKLTLRLMQSIDYDYVARRRIENFNTIHSYLQRTNCLKFYNEDAVPMAYPYYTRSKGLRERLINNNIYIPRYWPNVTTWTDEFSVESNFTNMLLPLPIDQRYGKTEMITIIDVIKKFCNL